MGTMCHSEVHHKGAALDSPSSSGGARFNPRHLQLKEFQLDVDVKVCSWRATASHISQYWHRWAKGLIQRVAASPFFLNFFHIYAPMQKALVQSLASPLKGSCVEAGVKDCSL